jgi:hypothetical protein
VTWEEAKLAFNYLTIGFALGYLWHPIWNIIKKIVTEAKKAREEW